MNTSPVDEKDTMSPCCCDNFALVIICDDILSLCIKVSLPLNDEYSQLFICQCIIESLLNSLKEILVEAVC